MRPHEITNSSFLFFNFWICILESIIDSCISISPIVAAYHLIKHYLIYSKPNQYYYFSTISKSQDYDQQNLLNLINSYYAS